MPEFTTQALIASMQAATDDVRDRVAVLIDQATAGVVEAHRREMPRSGATRRRFTDAPLADRVRVQTFDRLRQVVRSEAPHLHLVELGTVAREARTWRGKPLRIPRATGRMPTPAAQRFIPLSIRRRAEFLRLAEDVIGDREL